MIASLLEPHDGIHAFAKSSPRRTAEAGNGQFVHCPLLLLWNSVLISRF
ncbi:hypothetical protein [Streptomyces spiramyceticus]|nr:hypothetical protein [Streptomyces spiramyceticus]